MAESVLKTNETIIGKWKTNFLPEGGGRILGDLFVTEERILFEGQFDMSILGLNFISGGNINGDEIGKCIEIAKSEIKLVDTKESFINKKVNIHMHDGSIHRIDNGMMSVKAIVEALN